MAVGSIRGVEYVVTDETRNVIAVVRPVPGRPPGGVPRWAGDVKPCAVVVVGPDRTAGLVITGRGFSRAAHVLIERKALIGMVEPAERWGSLCTFSDCSCGKWRGTGRSKCICGAKIGSVQGPSRADGPWTVVDAQRNDIGRITPRRLAMDRGQTSAESTGARLGRWAWRLAGWLGLPRAPVVCEVVEADPGFDWRRHGVLVALATLCDRDAERLAIPPYQRGGP